MTPTVPDPLDAEQRLQAFAAGRASTEEIGQALDAVETRSFSHRRRIQADLLHRAFGEAAGLAARCGWEGRVVVDGGHVLIDDGGALLQAESAHFRSSRRSAAESLLAPLERFAIRPRVILDLDPGAGDLAIPLARRLPGCRVVAVDSSRERLEALDANLALQHPPPDNVEIVPFGLAPDPSVDRTEALRHLCASRRIRRIDLLSFTADSPAGGLAAAIRELDVPILAASVTFDRPAEAHGEILAALEHAGLVMLAKRSQPIADPRPWLAERLSGRPSITVLFVAKARLGPPRRDPSPLRARLYGGIDALGRMFDPHPGRFEFEKIYALKADPWRYLTNPYEHLKYRRTLECALRLRPDAGAVLEIACSIGVFTRMLARSFPQVTATDIAHEALKRARRRVGRTGQVTYVRGDIRRLRLGRRFDIIFCAEMLYYLPIAATQVLATLERHLAPGGLVFTVMPRAHGRHTFEPAPLWREALLQQGYQLVSEQAFEDPSRPYFIQAYARSIHPA